MSDYLGTATRIHKWLDYLQIKQERGAIVNRNNKRRMVLQHPVEGELDLTAELPAGEIFECHGMGLHVPPGLKPGDDIKIHDAGGIFDPIDGRVQGEHYSTSHFALLSAILHLETGEQRFLDNARKAIDFHLRTSPNEYAPFSEWMYHWDFQNYAFVLTYKLLQDRLNERDLAQWKTGLLAWQTNHYNKLANWAGMRAWAYAERNMLFGKFSDRMRMFWNLRLLERARRDDGCFDDNLNLSRPIQYHIFTVAILHRMLLLKNDAKLRRWFLEGVDYFTPFIDPDGDFNYIGRGQEQIFGYGAAIYALEAAALETGDRAYQAQAERIFDFLLRYQKGNFFPLVLNQRPDEERSGWYDYHHSTVYNAHLAAWLGLAHLLKKSRSDSNSPLEGGRGGVKSAGVKIEEQSLAQSLSSAQSSKAEFSGDGNARNTPLPPSRGEFSSKPEIWFSDKTDAAVLKTDTIFLALFGGAPEYLSEPGITPHHLWWKDFGDVFSCPGGPSKARYGKLGDQGSDENFFAPIAKSEAKWHLPTHKRAQAFELKNGHIRQKFDYGAFVVERVSKIENDTLVFNDEMTFSEAGEFTEFRFFNLPVQIEKFDIEIQNERQAVLRLKNGEKNRASLDAERGGETKNTLKRELQTALVLEVDGFDAPFETLETISGAKGRLRPLVKREQNFHAQAGKKHTLTIRIFAQSA